MATKKRNKKENKTKESRTDKVVNTNICSKSKTSSKDRLTVSQIFVDFDHQEWPSVTRTQSSVTIIFIAIISYISNTHTHTFIYMCVCA